MKDSTTSLSGNALIPDASQYKFGGSFTANGPRDIVKVNGYMNSQQYKLRVLAHQVSPYFKNHPNEVFQRDNSPVHKAVTIQNYIANKGFSTLRWPPSPPDSPNEMYIFLYLKYVKFS